MVVSGKKFVFWFFGTMFALGLVGIGIIIWLLSMPRVERDQRLFAMLIPQAYQKYRVDNGTWPEDVVEAAIHFRSENPDMVNKVKKAQSDWGLATRILNPDSQTPQLEIVFTKPQSQKALYALSPRTRKKPEPATP